MGGSTPNANYTEYIQELRGMALDELFTPAAGRDETNIE